MTPMLDENNVFTRGKYQGLNISDDAVEPSYLRFLYWRGVLPNAISWRILEEMIRRGVRTEDSKNNGKTGYHAKVAWGQRVREYKRLKASEEAGEDTL